MAAVAGAVARGLDLDVTPEVSRLYALTARTLRAAGKLIGANDLWIGCTARAAGLAIVTRDVAHFRRIPDLAVLSYSPDWRGREAGVPGKLRGHRGRKASVLGRGARHGVPATEATGT